MESHLTHDASQRRSVCHTLKAHCILHSISVTRFIGELALPPMPTASFGTKNSMSRQKRETMALQHVVQPVQQAASIGSPPAFPGPIMLSPTAMPSGGAPFLPAEFDATKLAPAGSVKCLEETTVDSKGDKGTPSDVGSDNQLGSLVAPVMNLPGTAMMHDARPTMPPLQPPPSMPNPHLPQFLSPPNMPHIPPQLMPGGPMFPPDRFRMPIPLPSRGPPFHRHPPMRPEVMDDRDGGHFRNGRPGFGYPPFHRGRW